MLQFWFGLVQFWFNLVWPTEASSYMSYKTSMSVIAFGKAGRDALYKQYRLTAFASDVASCWKRCNSLSFHEEETANTIHLYRCTRTNRQPHRPPANCSLIFPSPISDQGSAAGAYPSTSNKSNNMTTTTNNMNDINKNANDQRCCSANR